LRNSKRIIVLSLIAHRSLIKRRLLAKLSAFRIMKRNTNNPRIFLGVSTLTNSTSTGKISKSKKFLSSKIDKTKTTTEN